MVRHAYASRLDVSMEKGDERVICVLRDDGVGNAGEDTAPGGLGLRGIRDRLKGLHGELELQSSMGAGTQMIISIPIASLEHTNGD